MARSISSRISLDPVVGVLQIVAFLERLFQRDAQALVGHHLADDLIDTLQIGSRAPGPRRESRRGPCSVPNVPICATLASPYFVFDVLDDQSPRRSLQKSMSISGASQAAFVEEPFEQQIELQIGQTWLRSPMRIADQRADAAEPRAVEGMPLLIRHNGRKSQHNQKIVGEAEFVDDSQFVIESLREPPQRIGR